MKPAKRSFFGVAAILWIAWALAGFWLTPYDPQAQDFVAQRLSGGSAQHWLGIDGLGRDVLSRVWRGSGTTVVLGILAAGGTLALAAGLLVLEQAGPRWLKRLVRQVVSLGVALPVVFIGLVLVVFMNRSAAPLVLAAALGGVPFGYRQLRVVWLEQRNALYVDASQALGADWRHLLRFSIWPNIRPQVVALAKLFFAMGILELSGLTFLGLTGDPDFPELGTILRQNQAYLFLRPALVFWPGILLSGLLLVVHLSNVREAGG